MPTDRTIRIGSGAGYAGDRLEPAVELSTEPDLDYLVFECLAERTIALAQEEKLADPDAGYNPLLADRFEGVLGNCVDNDITIVTNMGAANPPAAAEVVADIASDIGVGPLTIATVTGSDVLDAFDAFDGSTFAGAPVESFAERAISANAYIGVDPIIEALDAEADVVITDRVSDVSLFLAPMMYEFGWSLPEDGTSERIGQGIATAHLTECAGHVTGGYFADPGTKDVDELANLGFPIAEIDPNGDAVITKQSHTGGMVDVETCSEQLLYEVHDPSAYITPDGVADFSEVTLTQEGEDRVRVSNAVAGPPPADLKVSIGYLDSIIGTGEISYAGPNAKERGRLAGEVVEKRLDIRGVDYNDLRVDLIGVNALHGDIESAVEPYEVRVRVAAKCDTEAEAEKIGREVQTLYNNGPAGGGGARMHTREVIGIVSTLVDRDVVDPVVAYHDVTADGEAAETVAGKRGEEAADGADGESADGVAA